MTLGERFVGPYTPLFKKIRTLGLILEGISTAILTGGVALPTVVISIAGYLATASEVAVAVSQCAVDADKSFDVIDFRKRKPPLILLEGVFVF